MLGAVGFFLVILFLGMPVAFAIAVAGFAFFLTRPEIPWTILVQRSLSEIGAACLESIWALLFPVLLIVFIRFGIMTPSESGAFAVFYALFVGGFVYKELNWKTFVQCLISSVKDLSVTTMILAFSGIFSYGVVFDQLPATLTNILVAVTDNKYILLFLILLMLTIFGMFMETTVITLICTPILVPLIQQYGIDPVHFGIIMMTVVTMGCSTPPVGVALYTCSNIMGCSVEETTRYSMAYYVAIIVTLLVCIFLPQVVLFLPDLVYGGGGI